MSGGTFVPRNECPGGHFFQGDSHSSDTGTYRVRESSARYKYYIRTHYRGSNVGLASWAWFSIERF